MKEELSFYDQCRLYSMQRRIDHTHIIDWIRNGLTNNLFLKKDVKRIVFDLRRECDRLQEDDINQDMLMLGLRRERLINYDNSNYFMNGVICANDDGTAHYPSQEVR